MGFLAQIDAEIQKDLIAFIQAQEKKPEPHTLGDVLLKDVFDGILKGNIRISGWAKNDEKKRVWLELTFYESQENRTEE